LSFKKDFVLIETPFLDVVRDEAKVHLHIPAFEISMPKNSKQPIFLFFLLKHFNLLQQNKDWSIHSIDLLFDFHSQSKFSMTMDRYTQY